MSNNAKLTRGSIPGHLVSQTAPMIVGVAAIMSIGLVDSYFIGQLGAQQLAAISFIFPISVALSSLGVGIMVGINSVVARAQGAGDDDRAARRATFGIVFAVGCGVVLGLALYALLDPLFRLMNADDALMPFIRTYMQPYAISFPLLLAIMGINGVLRGQGEARKTSLVSITYAAANWVLDPILVTGALGFEGFGIVGAAYATAIGWICGIIMAFFLLKRTPLPFDLSLLKRCDIGESAGAIMSVAGPAAFSNAINPIGLSILTALVAIEGQAAVAGFGAAGRLQSFAVVPLLALSGAIGGIVGQNWGASKIDRARKAVLYAGIFSVGYGLAIAVLLFSFGEWFADFFTEEAAVINQFARYLTIAAWGYAGYGLLIVGNGVLNAVDKAGLALAQSCARVFLVMLPFAWLLRGSWGADAVYGAELAANVVGGLVSAAVVWWVLKAKPEAPKNAGAPAEPEAA